MSKPAPQVAEAMDQPQEPGQALAPVVMWQDRAREEMLEDLLERLGSGITLSSLCEMPEFPPLSTLKRWKKADEDLAARFVRAREEFWESLAEDGLNILDGVKGRTCGDLDRDKARAAFRFQLLSRLDNRAALKAKAPKALGDYVPPEIHFIGVEPYQPAVVEGEGDDQVDDQQDQEFEDDPL